jgi:anthranilate synthase
MSSPFAKPPLSAASDPLPPFLEAATTIRYVTAGDIVVQRTTTCLRDAEALAEVAAALDEHRGALFTCGAGVASRYARADVGFVDPPLVLEGRGRAFSIRALNARGERLLPRIAARLAATAGVVELGRGVHEVNGCVPAGPEAFREEDRTRQPSIFTVVRALAALFASTTDDRLGLYGAFGYDLVFQLDALVARTSRSLPAPRDLVLYLPDRLIVVDHRRGRAHVHDYDFVVDWSSTEGLPREGAAAPVLPLVTTPNSPVRRDHVPGEYAQLVRRAGEAFARGDLFEVVPSQSWFVPLAGPPSEVFLRLIRQNPAPYTFFVNLGGGEHLIGASPEMFVRVTGDRVETAPIAGTIARGEDALADAEQVARLLASEKDAAELTMCTDVDRNDKSRVCVPGSVRVLARRQIEAYSRLIHTVDHVEGRLLPDRDALDAFVSHAWAVTITGAPKLAAMQFIEDHERAPRGFYGGAVGALTFDGRLDTGLALRMLQVREGVAEVRAGATLLHASDPDAEERETELKATALFAALDSAGAKAASPSTSRSALAPVSVTMGKGSHALARPPRLWLVDHRDSFVHTLANYFRQLGALVTTVRAGFAEAEFAAYAPDLVVLSPGPGTPAEGDLPRTIGLAVARGVPLFGVCLGLQGLVEYFGGQLGRLALPAHGQASRVRVLGEAAGQRGLFAGLPATFAAGRYHSLFARPEGLPPELAITAESEDGIPMAIEHAALPITAVQFHPESIMTAREELGLRLLGNVLATAREPAH